MYCVFCFGHPHCPGMKSAAKFVINGQSVCFVHRGLAQSVASYTEGRTKMLEQMLMTGRAAQ